MSVHVPGRGGRRAGSGAGTAEEAEEEAEMQLNCWLKKDIQYCKKIYLEPEEPDDLCLCHGMGGNYLALCFLEQQGLYLGLEKEREELKERLLSCMEGKLISAREKCNPALMTGLSGIGLALIFSEYNMLRE